jgi:D-arabinose 1-dehydrogenase-like Zn-dependent alcohol dehydrogenase
MARHHLPTRPGARGGRRDRAVGQDVPEHWEPGQRVGVGGHPWHCDNCCRGDFFACQTGVQGTDILLDGGYADYPVAPPARTARV